MVLDDPVLPASINAALFHDKPPSNASRLVWTRSQPKRDAPEPERPEAAPRRAAQRRKPQHGYVLHQFSKNGQSIVFPFSDHPQTTRPISVAHRATDDPGRKRPLRERKRKN